MIWDSDDWWGVDRFHDRATDMKLMRVQLQLNLTPWPHVGWAIYQEVSGEFSITEDIYLEAMEKHGGGR